MLLRSGRDVSTPSSASCASPPADPEPLIARLPGARKPVVEVIRGRHERPEQGRAGLVDNVRFALEDRAGRVHDVVRVVPVLCASTPVGGTSSHAAAAKRRLFRSRSRMAALRMPVRAPVDEAYAMAGLPASSN